VLTDLTARKGIVLELTAGYPPESNGAAKRLNRTLIERARAMLLDASLPLSLWDEAVVAACHVRNRSPIAGTQSGTPWRLLFGSVPDVSHLRVFGCKGFCRVCGVLRGKLDSVSYSGVFVGYSGGGHRVLVDGTNNCLCHTSGLCKVQVCGDVVFLEEPASRAELSSNVPAPKRKSAEPRVDVKRKTGVGADVLPVDSSISEDRFAVGLVPSCRNRTSLPDHTRAIRLRTCRNNKLHCRRSQPHSRSSWQRRRQVRTRWTSAGTCRRSQPHSQSSRQRRRHVRTRSTSTGTCRRSQPHQITPATPPEIAGSLISIQLMSMGLQS
jgi:hypothetical protein